MITIAQPCYCWHPRKSTSVCPMLALQNVEQHWFHNRDFSSALHPIHIYFAQFFCMGDVIPCLETILYHKQHPPPTLASLSPCHHVCQSLQYIQVLVRALDLDARWNAILTPTLTAGAIFPPMAMFKPSPSYTPNTVPHKTF